MGDLKIGNRQPSVGTLKQGTSNIAKIYKGDELVWPVGGEPDNYEPLPDDNVRFVGLYQKKLITYFTNVQTPFPFDPQYIDEEINYTGDLESSTLVFDQITAISDNMEYIYAKARMTGGVTYSAYKGIKSGSNLNFTSITDVDNVETISKDGQYVYGLSSVSGGSNRSILKISSDYGQTFSNEINFNDPINPNNIVDKVACSMGGKYVYAVFNTGQASPQVIVYKSDDYGSTFLNITSIVGLSRGQGSGVNFYPLVSGNGQYVYFYVSYSLSNLPSGIVITMSDNFGTSFFENPVDLRQTGITPQTDKLGKYLILSNWNSNQIGLVSTDYSLTSQDPNLSTNVRVAQSSLSNFGTVGLLETVEGLTTTSPNQTFATSVNSLQSFNESDLFFFPYQPIKSYGPIQKVVNIVIPPDEVQIGDLIWTTTNSTIVASSGGTIPILTNAQELEDAFDNSTPGAIYYDLDSANAGRGLLYNPEAAAAITPPTGFRLPTVNDWLSLTSAVTPGTDVTAHGGGANALWNQTIKSNAAYGSSGFNATKAGIGRVFTNSGNFFYDFTSDRDVWWNVEAITPRSGAIAYLETQYIISQQTFGASYPYWAIRFCKDA